MAKRTGQLKPRRRIYSEDYGSDPIPQSYGRIPKSIILDDDQQSFMDAIYNPDIDIIFCNAGAGSGKTLIAVAAAVSMIQKRMADEIIYITSPVHEHKQGFLAGSLQQKSLEYFRPLEDALRTIGIDPITVIKSDDLSAEKSYDQYITASTDSYIRGKNFGGIGRRTIVIADECQNMTIGQLKTLLSRVCDGSFCIAIGHDKQIDLKDKNKSGFAQCIRHFEVKEWAKICTLSKNYRGRVSQWADMLPDDK